MISQTLETQQLSGTEAIALARLQCLDETTIRVLETAWWFSERKIPIFAHYIATMVGMRMVAVKAARRKLSELKLWPHEKKVDLKPRRVEVPCDPIRENQAGADEEVPTFVQESHRETSADVAMRCVAEYDRAMRNLGKGKVR